MIAYQYDNNNLHASTATTATNLGAQQHSSNNWVLQQYRSNLAAQQHNNSSNLSASTTTLKIHSQNICIIHLILDIFIRKIIVQM